MKKLINRIIRQLGYKIINYSYFQEITQYKRSELSLKYLLKTKSGNHSKILHSLKDSKAQLLQDIFVLDTLNFKKKGYFVEFGGANGVDLSNTFLLEKNYDWEGIIAEPGKQWHKNIEKNRNVIFSDKCVWESSGNKLIFNETSTLELSTIDFFMSHDKHIRKTTASYEVETISLNDLLLESKAPEDIDYISIDTEGSEFQILKTFDFETYNVKIFTIEHNYTQNRELIHSLMVENGYTRVYEDISKFDDWYIRQC